MKSLIVALVVVAALASCPNMCSGHGACGERDLCHCFAQTGTSWGQRHGWTGADCSLRTCPLSLAWDTVSTLVDLVDAPIYATETTSRNEVRGAKLSVGSTTDELGNTRYTGTSDQTYMVKIERANHGFTQTGVSAIDEVGAVTGPGAKGLGFIASDNTVCIFGSAVYTAGDDCFGMDGTTAVTAFNDDGTPDDFEDLTVGVVATYSTSNSIHYLDCVFPSCFANVRDNDRLTVRYTAAANVEVAAGNVESIVLAKVSDNRVIIKQGEASLAPAEKVIITAYGQPTANTWMYKLSTDADYTSKGQIVANTEVSMADGIYVKFATSSTGYSEDDLWYIKARAVTSDDFSGNNLNFAHQNVECGGRGACDRKTGNCKCYAGWEGEACQRTVCPNECSGHGICQSLLRFASDATEEYDSAWDSTKAMGCKCDAGFRGPDCSLMECPGGEDPLLGDIVNGVYTYKGRDCSGRGLCDYSSGVCQCFKGYFGERCENQVNCM